MQKPKHQKEKTVKTILKNIKAKVDKSGFICFFIKHSWRSPRKNQRNCSRCGTWRILTMHYDVNKGREIAKWKKMNI